MFSITYRFEDVEVVLSADTVEDVLALDDAYNAEDGWITWSGGECPVDRDTMVNVRSSNGDDTFGKARQFYWYRLGSADDIVAYKVVKNV